MQSDDLRFMQRALELAERGRGAVSPNPLVGCVIIYNGKIIGEGWHRQYGRAHAEVNAVNSVVNPSLLSESTCYVTLEPCSHQGKTPPCADMLVRHRLKRVVVAAKDSNPLVGGKGIAKLKAGGLEVIYGIAEAEARSLNVRFFTAMEKKRPYVLLKWAQTADGFTARKNYDSKWISNAQSRKLVHQWRADEDAILVGTNTAYYDNPRLNVRGITGSDPVRVVIDRQLRLDSGLHLFDKTQPTLCYNLKKHEDSNHLSYIRLPKEDFLGNLLADLLQRKIHSVLVEGGSFLLKRLIEKGLWDEARVFKSLTTFGEGIAAPQLTFEARECTAVADDQLSIYHNPEPK